jgi:hypothetical protein
MDNLQEEVALFTTWADATGLPYNLRPAQLSGWLARAQLPPEPPSQWETLTGRQRESWQPINTAPRDGTRVLLLAPYPEYSCPMHMMVARTETITDGYWSLLRLMWVTMEMGNVVMTLYPKPTHWMPLPETPIKD